MSGVRGMPLPDSELAPCGTLAAARRHYRRGQVPLDRACLQAMARYHRDRIAAGYVRPPRRSRARTHLADTDGTTLCGRPAAAVVFVAADPDRATCRYCAAVLRRQAAREARSRAA